MGNDAVVVYYKPGCPFGIKLRAGLWLKGIPYSALRFRDDEAGAAMVREVNNGNEVSPTVRIGSRYLSNPSVEAVLGVLTA